MPVTTPKQKIQKTEIFGGDAIQIELVGDYFDDCLKAAKDFCKKKTVGIFYHPSMTQMLLKAKHQLLSK